jgi:cytidyltransferase-like protein
VFDDLYIIPVLLTLSYSDQFLYPLTLPEIEERLILLDQKQRQFNLLASLQTLTKLKLINAKNGYYFLTGSEKFITLRQQRAQLAQAKWLEVTDCVAMLKKIPWIKGVFVTGSLAVNNVVTHDDIDFMIVTQNQRLWLSRLLVLALTALAHKRRTWKEGGQDTWCFNMWLEETDLAISAANRNIYSAYEVFQAKCVFDVDDIESKFYAQNQWASQYLQNFHRVIKSDLKPKQQNFAWLRWLTYITNPVLAVLNLLAFMGQWLYMKPHKTIEQVGLNKALFHPRNTHAWVNKRWQTSLLKLLPKIVLVTGVFDILHQEHINFLVKAKEQGDELWVGIETDARVRQLKGEGRPINSQDIRLKQLKKLKLANHVFILPAKFDQPADHEALIAQIRPAVLAVSSHTPFLAAKKKLVEKYGGQLVVVLKQNPAISSTILLKKASTKD